MQWFWDWYWSLPDLWQGIIAVLGMTLLGCSIGIPLLLLSLRLLEGNKHDT